jgi:hypothetical protein
MIFFKFIVLFVIFFSIQSYKEKGTRFTVNNPLGIERSFETVEIPKDFLKVNDLTNIGIKDLATGKLQVTQNVDTDGNGVMDVLLFQPVIGAK